MSLNSNKALEAGAGYTIGNILIKGLAFLSVPLFSRILNTEQFGIYNVFISYDSFLSIVIGLALHSSVRSANLKFENKVSGYTSSVTIIVVLNTLLFLIFATVFSAPISRWTGFDKPVIYALILYSFGSAIISLYNERISLNYAYKTYLIVAFINSIGNIIISLLFMFFLFPSHMELGRIFGTTTVMFCIGVVLCILLFFKVHPRFNKQYWKFGLSYSLPIIPHGISQVLLGQIDRIMIQRYVSSSAAGIYSLAGNIKLILTVLTSSISSAWSTWFYEQMKSGNFKNVQTRAKQLSLLFTIFAIGLIALSPELIWILGGEIYMEGKYVAVPMIIDAFIVFLYNVIVPSEYYMGKTTYIMLGTMGSAVINVIANYVFIRKFGYIAAAYTTLFSYVCYLVFHCIISRHLIGGMVLSLKNMLFDIILIAFMSWCTLIFSNSILIRYMFCAVLVIPCAVYLLSVFVRTSTSSGS